MRAHGLKLRGVMALAVVTGGLLFGAVPALAAFPEAPVVEAPSPVGGTTATLKGELNPGAATEKVAYRFAYSAAATCTESGLTAPVEPFPEAEGNHRKVSAAVTGLEGSTEYTVCLIAANPAEPAELTQGTSVKFKTPTTNPVIPSETAPSVTPVGVTLEAKVNPENQATKYHFEYSSEKLKVEEGEGTPFGEGSFSGPGLSEAQTAGPAETGAVLTSSTPYYYRVVATNGTGTEDGKVEEFTTSAFVKPAIEAESATGVTHTNAELHAAINPEYQETEYQFKLGTTNAYGVDVPAALTGIGGSGFFGDLEPAVNVQGELEAQSLEALKPNTEYHYQAVAKNGTGETKDADATFLTLPDPPAVTTEGASSITATSESIAGSVNPGASGHLAEDDTTYYVEYGATIGYGKQTPFPAGEAVELCRLKEVNNEACPQGVAIVGEGTSTKAETVNLDGLEPGRTYHYRVVATNLNNAGELNANEPSVYGEHLMPQTVYGEDHTFETTATLPVLGEVAAFEVTQHGATISAQIDGRGLPTHWEVQLGATPKMLQYEDSGDQENAGRLTLPVGSLTPGTTYYFKVVVINADGTVESPEGTFTTAPGPAAATPPVAPALIPYPSIAELDAKEAKEAKGIPTPIITKTLTKAEKLKKALKACKKKKGKKRSSCEAAAHKKFGSSKKKKQ